MPNPLWHSLCVMTCCATGGHDCLSVCFSQTWKREGTHAGETYLTDLFSIKKKKELVDVRFSLCHFLYDMKKKLWCILCDLLLVCHRSRSVVSYRLICNVLRQSAYPFRYTVEKRCNFNCFLMHPTWVEVWFILYVALQENMLYRTPYLHGEKRNVQYT